MSWQELRVAPDGSHHLRENQPAYPERFEEVLKFHAPGLAPVRRGGEAWHIHPDGRRAYPQSYRRTFGFYQDRAAFEGLRGWGHVLPDGSELTEPSFAWCGNFQGGRCTVRTRDEGYHHLRLDGTPAYPQRWRYAGDFRDGAAVIQGEDGLSTHIDPGGALLHGRWFLDLDVFHKGFARARDPGGWTHVDARGQPLYARRFAAVEPFYNGQARVEREDGALEVVDEQGETRVVLREPRSGEFHALSADLVGSWRTQTIAAAVELGVFEALPASIEEIRLHAGLHRDGALRLLRALGELGLVQVAQETWSPTPRGQLLREDSPRSLAAAAVEYARSFHAPWSRLPESLRESSDWQPPPVFDQVASREDRGASHHRTLASYASHDYQAVPGLLGLQGSETVLDVGGGLGALASLLVTDRPGLQVTILERPEVVELARGQSHPENVSFREQDFFEPWNQEADLVLLARVLHDWDDAGAREILRRAREALLPGGYLAILEMLLPEAGYSGALCDLHLHVVHGGRERTRSEFERLLRGADLELLSVRPTSSIPHLLLARRRSR